MSGSFMSCGNKLIEEMALAPTDGLSSFNTMKSSRFSCLSERRHDEVDSFVG
jgi:hypothetical protein